MNPFVESPDWGWWIIAYFFLGGLAAGAYFTATLIELTGGDEDVPLARVGYWIAFPLVVICGLFLTVDLTRPERFWHMLFDSDAVHSAFSADWPWKGAGWREMRHALLMKVWSPMSVGAWALMVFGTLSALSCALSFLGSLWPQGRLARWCRRSIFARTVQVLGCLTGFFIAAYTGALLAATNQPIWSQTTWIAPLFLASAASSGIAALLLIGLWRGRVAETTLDRLEQADLWAIGVEIVFFAIFIGSLGDAIWPILRTWQGMLLILGTGLIGLLIPLAIHLRGVLLAKRAALLAAALVLIGSFMLRYGILAASPALLRHGSAVATSFSPEDGRVQGTPGAGPP